MPPRRGAAGTKPKVPSSVPERLRAAVLRLVSRDPIASRKSQFMSALDDSVTFSAVKEGGDDAKADEEETVMASVLRSLSHARTVEVFGLELSLYLLTTMDMFFSAEGEDLDDDDDDDDNEDYADDSYSTMENDLVVKLKAALAAMEKKRATACANLGDPNFAEKSVVVGNIVRVSGLVSRPDLNGKRVKVLSWKAETGRYQVRELPFATPWKALALRPERLSPCKDDGAELQRSNMSVVSTLTPALEEAGRLIKRRPRGELRQVLTKAFVERGGAAAMSVMLTHPSRSGKSARGCEVVDLLKLQQDAETLAFCNSNGKSWTRIPDALCIKGAAMFARGHCAEATTLLSAALASRPERWAITANRHLASSLLVESRRQQPPLIGRWVERRDITHPDDEDLLPQARCGLAYCGDGDNVYVFGGLQSTTTRAQGRRPLIGALDDVADYYSCPTPSSGKKKKKKTQSAAMGETPTNGLYVLDLSSKKKQGRWRRITAAASSLEPPKQAFAQIALYKNQLWLFGGRDCWSLWRPKMTHFSGEVWCFDLATRIWRRLPGKTPRFSRGIGPSAVHKTGWFIVDNRTVEPGEDDSEPATSRRFDFELETWSEPEGSGGPRIRAGCAGWKQDNSLFVWTIGKTKAGFSDPAIYSLALEGNNKWGQWTKHAMVCPPIPTEGCGIGFGFNGHATPTWIEASASFDAKTRKAYIFGGWNEDMYDCGVKPDHPAEQAHVLSGKYYGILLEIDVDKRVMRAVETSSACTTARGPGARGFAMTHARTSPTGASSVLCGFGYTTFDARRGGYSTRLGLLGDLWECKLIGQEAARHVDALNEVKETVAGTGAPHRATVVQLDLGKCFDTLRGTLMESVEIRKRVGEWCPGQRGALVAHVFDHEKNFAPVQPAAFYTAEYLRANWLPIDDIRKRFKNLEQYNPEVLDLLKSYHPVEQFAIVYVGAEVAGQKVSAQGASYILFGCYFSRWRPGGLYVDTKKLKETNDLASSISSGSERKEETATTLDSAYTKQAQVDVCGFLECPRRFLGVDNNGRGPNAPKLSRCANCGVVMYCSPTCQRSHWTAHKSLCRQLNPK